MSEKQILEYVRDMLQQIAEIVPAHQATLRHVLAMGELECEVQLERKLTAVPQAPQEDSLKVA